MTIKTLLFLLLLYICLVWVGAAYLHPALPEFRDLGLKWTMVGLIAVFAFIVGSHLLSWWRAWRAKSRQKPKAAPKPGPGVHEDDAALAAAIGEANAALARAPGYSSLQDPIYRLPWRLLVGPEGSGKTSVLLNSGIEPQLLSGHAANAGSIAPTRVCNIWLAKHSIFVEIAGRAFDGDLARWTQLLRVVRGGEKVPMWRRLLGKREQTVMLRGVIACCDLREFQGASADPQRFERSCRNWHDRLQAISEIFGPFPVYQILTKSDGIPFFQEFFHQLPESDTKQVLGCTLVAGGSVSAEPKEVQAEAESKRLTKAFRALYQSLAERRLTQLAYETNPAYRPAIYEFPRELKRIRGSIVQFLVDAFRPDALRPNPILRGYYFTAVREVEVAATAAMGSTGDWQTIAHRGVFAAEATQMFHSDVPVPSIGRERPKRMGRRWSFVSDLFHRVILADAPLQTTTPVWDPRFERYRRKVFAGVLAVCGVLSLVFFASWFGNRNLLNDVTRAVAGVNSRETEPSVANLRRLDDIRIQVERLRGGAGWWLHFGLYSGNGILNETRAAYFRRFQALLLNDLNREMTDKLKALTVARAKDASEDPAYRTLKTHLIISAGNCPVEPPLVSQVLKGVANDLYSRNGSEWERLSDRQIDFYASELVYGNAAPLSEDAAAVRQAREYLKNIGGVDRIYNAILASTQKSVAKPKGLGEVAPNYAQVLRSQGAPTGFTIEGWNFVVNASKDQKSALQGDCVFAGDEQIEASAKADTASQASLATEIQRRYVQDYVRSWKDFLAGHSVIPYANPGDAVNKLGILSSSQSPLLGLFAMTADQTNFATEAKTPTAVEGLMKTVEKAASMVTQAKPDLRPSPTEAAIAQSFQPVHIVVPPKSERWVTEKNTPYVEALSRLGAALRAISMSTDSASREAAVQAAIPIKQGALDAAEKIAREFNRTDLAEVAERLLKQPIHLTDPFTLPAKPGEQPNGSLTQLCKAYGSTFEKYPFRKSSTQDATLEELTAWFAPMTGQIWKFRAEALASFTEPENGHWKAKEGQGPQITPEMLRFLNRAQDIAATVYAKGPQPQFTYVLRPKLDSSFKSSTVELEVDGQLHQWNSIFQKEFTWPAAPGAKVVGAIFRIRSDNVAYAFNSHPGVWGVFKMMADAEPRGPKSALIEWKYSSVHDLIQPAPVRMEFPEFPNGVDIFQPDFFGGMRCPPQAVSAR